jgi:hypothetical protein
MVSWLTHPRAHELLFVQNKRNARDTSCTHVKTFVSRESQTETSRSLQVFPSLSEQPRPFTGAQQLRRAWPLPCDVSFLSFSCSHVTKSSKFISCSAKLRLSCNIFHPYIKREVISDVFMWTQEGNVPCHLDWRELLEVLSCFRLNFEASRNCWTVSNIPVLCKYDHRYVNQVLITSLEESMIRE